MAQQSLHKQQLQEGNTAIWITSSYCKQEEKTNKTQPCERLTATGILQEFHKSCLKCCSTQLDYFLKAYICRISHSIINVLLVAFKNHFISLLFLTFFFFSVQNTCSIMVAISIFLVDFQPILFTLHRSQALISKDTRLTDQSFVHAFSPSSCQYSEWMCSECRTTSWSPKSTILRLFGLDCCQVEQVKIVGQVNKSPANTATLHKDVNQELCLDVPNPFYNDLRCLL